jgi:hypothetical protein
MKFNVLAKIGEGLVGMFWQSCDVKKFVVHLLKRYADSTDNDVDDMVVELVRARLLVNCPDK